jgi:hypothetical protein
MSHRTRVGARHRTSSFDGHVTQRYATQHPNVETIPTNNEMAKIWRISATVNPRDARSIRSLARYANIGGMIEPTNSADREIFRMSSIQFNDVNFVALTKAYATFLGSHKEVT